MIGWTREDDVGGKSYTPMERDALVADIESFLSRAEGGFAMACINVMLPNGFTLKRADAFNNADDLLCKLMDSSLTCSIADVGSVLDDQILIITLVETDGSTTNIDADVMDAISKLSFKGGPAQPSENLSAFVRYAKICQPS